MWGVDLEATLLLEGQSGRHEKWEQSGHEARPWPHVFLRWASEHRQLALRAGSTGPIEATALTSTPWVSRAWRVQENVCAPLCPVGDWQGCPSVKGFVLPPIQGGASPPGRASQLPWARQEHPGKWVCFCLSSSAWTNLPSLAHLPDKVC